MQFSEQALIQCGFELAQVLRLPPPSHQLFRAKVQEILIEREYYEAALNGIITQEETALLMLQHFQTLISKNARENEPSLTDDWRSLIPSTIAALFVKRTNA